jgi:hypothetical protein
VAQPVHRMLVTGAVLRDPLLVSASAQHARDDITTRARRPAWTLQDAHPGKLRMRRGFCESHSARPSSRCNSFTESERQMVFD